MSDTYSTTPPAQAYPTDTGSGSTADVAKEQASHVAGGVADAGAKVAGTAKEEGAKVLSEAKTQVKDLYEQTMSEVSDQATTQQQRVATGLKSISDELNTMADNAPGGVASDLVQQVATRAGSIASWLEQRDPGSLLSDVQGFARQRPGTFIAIAARMPASSPGDSRDRSRASRPTRQTKPRRRARRRVLRAPTRRRRTPNRRTRLRPSPRPPTPRKWWRETPTRDSSPTT
jgi:hypothetical protein